MKKILMLFISLLSSTVLTFFFFEMMSWYHFGDVPTKVVLLRLIFVGAIIFAVLCLIGTFVFRKNK